MTLHFYFARRFALIFMGLLGLFFLLITLIDLVEQTRRHASSGTSFGEVFGLTLLNAPAGLYQMLPLVMILSTVTLFLGLSRSSELVVTRAAGRSGLVALIAPALVAVLAGVFTIAVFNPIVAATSKRFNTLDERYLTGREAVFSISSQGLWLRQADANGQTVIRAQRAGVDGAALYDVTFLSFGADGSPERRIEAATARLEPGAWHLQQVKLWPLAAGQNPEALAQVLPEYTVTSELTQDGIRDSFGDPSMIPIWELPAFITQLEQAGFSARRHAVWLHMELARPVFFLALLLVAAAFTMRHAGSGRTGIAVLSAVLLGFGLYYIRNFAQILGENGQVPVVLAGWAPSIAALLLGLGIVLHQEEA